MASSEDAALPTYASSNPSVPVYTTMASIGAADDCSVPVSDSEENVKAFIDGVLASAEADDLAFKTDDGDGTIMASIEKAGLFPDSNDKARGAMLRNRHKWNKEKEGIKDQIRILIEKVRCLNNQIASRKVELEEPGGVVPQKVI